MASATSDLLASLSQLSRLTPAVMIAAVAMGACSQASKADAATLIGWLSSTYELNVGVLLALALAVGLYLLKTMVPKKPKVYVLDFAVHRPHDRWGCSVADLELQQH